MPKGYSCDDAPRTDRGRNFRSFDSSTRTRLWELNLPTNPDTNQSMYDMRPRCVALTVRIGSTAALRREMTMIRGRNELCIALHSTYAMHTLFPEGATSRRDPFHAAHAQLLLPLAAASAPKQYNPRPDLVSKKGNSRRRALREAHEEPQMTHQCPKDG